MVFKAFGNILGLANINYLAIRIITLNDVVSACIFLGNILGLTNINTLAISVITLHDVDTACILSFFTSGDATNKSVSVGVGQINSQLFESVP